jgi:hypothetical protein
MANLTTAPTITRTVDQRFLIEPLGGPQDVRSYLDRFPEEVYSKSLDSHLVKFMYSMLGPAGIGHIRRNFLQARLIFEANGLELFDLDRFYGNPFQFGRISDESYSDNVLGLLSQDEWEKIKGKDARYRNRMLDFFAGARAGNTPLGMRLVAKSGLGHEVEVVENYKALFDQNSDDPLGLPYYGKTRLLNEMIVMPRQEAPKVEMQRLFILGDPTGGTFTLTMGDETTDPIAWNATARDVERLFSKLVDISHIIVEGGPLPDQAMTIKFIGALAGKMTQLVATNSLTGGTSPQIVVTAVTVQDGSEYEAAISPADQRHLQEALDRIRPVNVIPTFTESAGNQKRIDWTRATASSEFDEMLRYVTGAGGIFWPPRDNVHWIEQGIEHQAPRAHDDQQYHYNAFHNVVQVDSYDNLAFTTPDYPNETWHAIKERFVSNHIGTYEPHHSALFPFLRQVNNEAIQTADMALADYSEPLTITRVVDIPGGTVNLINGIYPADYQTAPGAPTVRYRTEQFWSSREKTTGDEYLELDLGSAKAINYLTFELTRKPLIVSIEYDLLDQGGNRAWYPVRLQRAISAPTTIYFSPTEQNPWRVLDYFFTNAKGEMIYTRYVRLKFARQAQVGFLGTSTSTTYPWSVDVRNLRIGRSVANQ